MGGLNGYHPAYMCDFSAASLVFSLQSRSGKDFWINILTLFGYVPGIVLCGYIFKIGSKLAL